MTKVKFYFALFTITQSIFLGMVLITIPHLMSLNGNIPLFDVRPMGYSVEEASLLLNSLKPEGIDYYLSVQHFLDFIYPGLFILCYGSTGWLFLKEKKFQTLNILTSTISFVGGGLDYSENIIVRKILMNFPTIDNQQVMLASNLTQLKSLFCTVAITITLGILGIHFIKRNKTTTHSC